MRDRGYSQNSCQEFDRVSNLFPGAGLSDQLAALFQCDFVIIFRSWIVDDQFDPRYNFLFVHSETIFGVNE
jgi:hypothetical protein